LATRLLRRERGSLGSRYWVTRARVFDLGRFAASLGSRHQLVPTMNKDCSRSLVGLEPEQVLAGVLELGITTLKPRVTHEGYLEDMRGVLQLWGDDRPDSRIDRERRTIKHR